MPVEKNKAYGHCPPRRPVTYEVDEETAKIITDSARIIPLFEKGMFENAYRKHYSFSRNENLRCAWTEYKKHIETRVYAPFQFPNERDLHFYNGAIRFVPSESDYKRPTYRKSLKPGPGVDYGGQMPIPQELLMKRTTVAKQEKGKIKKGSKGKQKVKSAKPK